MFFLHSTILPTFDLSKSQNKIVLHVNLGNLMLMNINEPTVFRINVTELKLEFEAKDCKYFVNLSTFASARKMI